MNQVTVCLASTVPATEYEAFFEKWRASINGPSLARWETWKSSGAAYTLILVDAHAEFGALCDFFTKELGSLDTHPWSGRAFIAFVSPTASSLAQVNTDDSDAQRRLQMNSFLIKMARSYRWGRITRLDTLAALMARLARAPEDLFLITRESIDLWKQDIIRIQECSRELAHAIDKDVRGGDTFWPNLICPSEDLSIFIRSLACVYLYGRLDQVDVESLAQAGAQGLPWLRRQSGLYQLEEAKRELLEQSKEIRLGFPEFTALVDGSSIDGDDAALPDRVLRQRSQLLLKLASQRIIIDAKIKLLEYLRDLASCVSRGTAVWASSSKIGKRPLRVLAIKDFVRQQNQSKELEESFKTAFTCAFREGDVTLDCYIGPRTDTALATDKWDTYEWWHERVVNQKPLLVNLTVPTSGTSEARLLLDYDVIIIEMEYRTRFVGVSIVQWLAAALDELEQSDAGVSAAGSQYSNRPCRRPQVIALSRNEKAGHGYICLSHGAEAFAHKSRVYGLPALLTYCRVGIRYIAAEPRYSRPNFRALYGVLPEVSSRLRSDHFDDLIIGDEWDRRWLTAMPKADLHYHIGTSITHPTVEALAFNTAGYVLARHERSTKRTDEANSPGRGVVSAVDNLLTHVCRTVLVANLGYEVANTRYEAISAQQALWGATRFICLPRDRDGAVHRPHIPERNPLEQAVAWLARQDRPFQAFEACGILVAALSVFEKAINAVAHGGKSDAKTFYELLSDPEYGFQERLVTEILAEWSYCHAMSLLYEKRGTVIKNGTETPQESPLAKSMIVKFHYLMMRINGNWKHPETGKEMRTGYDSARTLHEEFRSKGESVYDLPAWWGSMYRRVTVRVAKTVQSIVDKFCELLEEPAWLNDEFKEFTASGGAFMLKTETVKSLTEMLLRDAKRRFPGVAGDKFQCITLRRLVVLEDTVKDATSVKLSDRTLARYLWGAGVLGAEHLQFPENLLLATFDVVRQNVTDNVVYSEVRCGTNGYCEAGMNPTDATELLCLGYDFAATFFGWIPKEDRKALAAQADRPSHDDIDERMAQLYLAPPQRWVRTNVLLGAKRHKNAEEFAEIVSLVRHYLERGREPDNANGYPESEVAPERPGKWWDQCAVVGFDLSGDETKEFHDLRDRVQPLFVVSAPITIHAGEAATAESIWDAVYSLGAQRIGHGLRLREDQKLLHFCSRRGICMELCPISNSFTNVFDIPNGEVTWSAQRQRDNYESRCIYPLRSFLEAGLDVCLNTDNRAMHKRGSLTDEYLVAAELVGGMTRWEALKLSKAGFKCAFMSKVDVAAVLRHVEYEVYKLVSDLESDKGFVVPGRVIRRDC